MPIRTRHKTVSPHSCDHLVKHYSDGLHAAQDSQDSEMEHYYEHGQIYRDNHEREVYIERRGSIWQEVGDYIIHINGNGQIESHKINETKISKKIDASSEENQIMHDRYNQIESQTSSNL